jgi:hypothetical protein
VLAILVTLIFNASRGPDYGHGGWIPGYVSSLRHYAEPGWITFSRASRELEV